MKTYKNYRDNKFVFQTNDWLSAQENSLAQYVHEDWQSGQTVFTSIDDIPTWGTTPQDQFMRSYVGCKLSFNQCQIERSPHVTTLRKRGNALDFNTSFWHEVAITVDLGNPEGFVQAEMDAMQLIAENLRKQIYTNIHLSNEETDSYLYWQLSNGGWTRVEKPSDAKEGFRWYSSADKQYYVSENHMAAIKDVEDVLRFLEENYRTAHADLKEMKMDRINAVKKDLNTMRAI